MAQTEHGRAAEVVALDEMSDAVRSFCDFALGGGGPQAAEADEQWGTHEVLAHLVYWHERYADLLHRQLRGMPVTLPTDSLKQLNAAAVVGLADQSMARLCERFLTAQHRIERLASEGIPEDLAIQIKQGAKRWPWREFVKRVRGHIRGHQAELRRRRRGSP